MSYTGSASESIRLIGRHATTESLLAQALALDALAGHADTALLQQLLARRLLTKLAQAAWVHKAPLGELLAVINALGRYDQTMLSGTMLASAARRLVNAETAPGGPYRAADDSLDIYTNLQAYRFSAWAASPLPAVETFIHQRPSGYHSTIFPEWLEVMSLRSLGFADSTPQPTRGLASVMLAPHTPSQIVPAIIALTVNTPVSVSRPASVYARKSQDLYRILQTRLQKLDGLLRHQAIGLAQRIQQADSSHEISTLPHMMHDSLQDAPDTDLDALGLANIYCWMAYMTYDHIMDGQDSAAQLPLAGIAARETLHIYRAVAPHLTGYVERCFTHMDSANAWELQHARWPTTSTALHIGKLPQYGGRTQLASRSYAHVLGPLCLLSPSTDTSTSTAFRQAEIGFRHYLIARQLLDDMQDWREDMQAGHITYVVAAIIGDMRIKQGWHSHDNLQQASERQFWQATATRLCTVLDEHLGAARHAFEHSGRIRPHSPLEGLLDDLSERNEHTRRRIIDSQTFVRAFTKPTQR